MKEKKIRMTLYLSELACLRTYLPPVRQKNEKGKGGIEDNCWGEGERGGARVWQGGGKI